jgi:hypothetical protein
MPVKRRPPLRLDMPPASMREHAELLADPGTPLDEEKWERWTAPRGAHWHRPGTSYRDDAVRVLDERGLAHPALGLDPDRDVSRRAAAILAAEADERAEWKLHGAIGFGTDQPADPAELEVWRAEQAAPYRYAAEFWRDRLVELEDSTAHESASSDLTRES